METPSSPDMKTPSISRKRYRRFSSKSSGRWRHLPSKYRISSKFRRHDERPSSYSVSVRRRRYTTLLCIIFCTTFIRMLTCVTIIFLVINFNFKYLQIVYRIYDAAKATFSAELLIYVLGSITYTFCGIEVVLLAVQFMLLLTFASREYTFCGISISVDFALFFLTLLFYLLLLAVGFNSPEISSTIIAGVGSLLQDSQQKFMFIVDDVQNSMLCCGFAANYTEWMQDRIIYYYDPIAGESKVMLAGNANEIWTPRNEEENKNLIPLSCCSNMDANNNCIGVHEQGCFEKLSSNIVWMMNCVSIAMAIQLMLSVLQEAIFAFVAVDITVRTKTTTEIIIPKKRKTAPKRQQQKKRRDHKHPHFSKKRERSKPRKRPSRKDFLIT